MMNTTLIEEKKYMELTEVELNNVSGGGKYVYEGHVGKYDGVVGENYFFVRDGSDEVHYGILVRSYEKHIALWLTQRVHVVRVGLHSTFELSGDHYTMYTSRRWVN